MDYGPNPPRPWACVDGGFNAPTCVPGVTESVVALTVAISVGRYLLILADFGFP